MILKKVADIGINIEQVFEETYYSFSFEVLDMTLPDKIVMFSKDFAVLKRT